jgi:hypothetical protein
MTPSGPVRRAAILAILVVCVGALAFGLWHVIVGGVINGNPRAESFGITLAAVAGGFLLGLTAAFRRRRSTR